MFDFPKIQTRFNFISKTTRIFLNRSILSTIYHVIMSYKK